MFKRCETDELSYFINEESAKLKNWEQTFEFLGMFMAKAIWDKTPLNLCLNPLLLKYILGKSDDTELEDLKCFDTVHYNSLRYINENPIDDDPLIEQYFVYEHSDGTVHELAVEGTTIRVTDENKMQYSIVKIDYLTKDIVIGQL
jgi:hypothetical protein